MDLPSAAKKRREKSGEITGTRASFVLPLAGAQNVRRQLDARVDAELIESSGQVRFHRSFTDLQPLGNVGGSLARSNKLGDLVFAPRQAHSAHRACHCKKGVRTLRAASFGCSCPASRTVPNADFRRKLKTPTSAGNIRIAKIG
ncbi:MAG: hypothetical protein ABSB70_10625 [Candidatus Velthaea sp.]